MRGDVATRALGVVIAGVFLLFLGAASQWQIEASGEEALVRLSWRIEPVRIESCRSLTEAELAEVPAHMRRAETCQGGAVDYELRLEIDGVATVVDTIAPSGLRRDRPVYVYRDHAVSPGRTEVAVHFAPIVEDEAADAVAPHTWDGVVALQAREIALLTLSADASRLERRGGQ